MGCGERVESGLKDLMPPYRVAITYWHRCPFCRQSWPQFISGQRQKIRRWIVPCPDCVSKKRVDLVALLLEIEERHVEEDSENEDFTVVKPPVRETEEE